MLHDGSTGVTLFTQKVTGSGGRRATGSGSGCAPGRKVSDYTL